MCVTTWAGSIKYFCCILSEVYWLSGKKNICVIELQTELATFFLIEHDIYSEEQLTDKIR